MLIFVSQAPLVHASKPPTPRLVCRSSLSSRAAQAAPATAPCSDHVSRSTVDIHGNLARVLSTEQPDTVSSTEQQKTKSRANGGARKLGRGNWVAARSARPTRPSRTNDSLVRFCFVCAVRQFLGRWTVLGSWPALLRARGPDQGLLFENRKALGAAGWGGVGGMTTNSLSLALQIPCLWAVALATIILTDSSLPDSWRGV